MENICSQITISEIVQIILMLSYVIITGWILTVSIRQTSESLRPKVYADFRFYKQSMSFVIKNVGERAAYKINTQISPSLNYLMPNEQDLNVHPMLKKLLFLSPNEEAVTSLGTADKVLNMQKDNLLNAKIIYYDEKGKEYSENYSLDIDSYRRNYVDRKDISNIADSLVAIKGDIKTISGKIKKQQD